MGLTELLDNLAQYTALFTKLIADRTSYSEEFEKCKEKIKALQAEILSRMEKHSGIQNN